VHTKTKIGKRAKTIPVKFDVKITMKNKRFIMFIEEFCSAINVPNVGRWEEIPCDSDEDLRTFWRSISVDVPNDIHRSGFSHIQHPGLRYFALFLVRRFLAINNVTTCTGPIVYLLRCARNGVFPIFNVGVILVRGLSYVVCHSESKPLFVGAIATMVYEQ
jgi:hypothetical protein